HSTNPTNSTTSRIFGEPLGFGGFRVSAGIGGMVGLGWVGMVGLAEWWAEAHPTKHPTKHPTAYTSALRPPYPFPCKSPKNPPARPENKE
ncbi:TPA: hypothetical protein ACI6I8_002099, partial [Neisseria meningitidis]